MDWIINNVGVDLLLTLDTSLGYEFPFYTENQYTVWQPVGNALVGGKSHITIALYFFKITIFIETIGAKL
jgi:hypothetical protein